MAGKYAPLQDALRAAAERGQSVVDLGFDEVGRLVGGLPSSSAVRQWWANNSQVQALAWRDADFHVEQVALDRRRVRFVRGAKGGSYADRGRRPAAPSPARRAPARRAPVDDPVDVRLRLQWLDGGVVTLDGSGKPAFDVLDSIPGLYRMTLTGGALDRPQIYIGESDNLNRRSGNYRNPGAGQQTSLRINALLREHLDRGGQVSLAVMTTATMWLAGEERPWDLTRKAGRLLAENAALVTAHIAAGADIVNLG